MQGVDSIFVTEVPAAFWETFLTEPRFLCSASRVNGRERPNGCSEGVSFLENTQSITPGPFAPPAPLSLHT